jgi:hypothetical protein
MATATRIYKAEDWKIYVYVPESGAFTLDFSRLNGADVLGTTGGGLQPIEAQIANISLTEGSEITQGLFSTIEPARMNAELIIENFTASDANKFYVGSECSLFLVNPTPTTSYTVGAYTFSRTNETMFFYGFIESFNVDVMPGSNYATISISALSNSSRDLNTLIGVDQDVVTPKNTLIANTGIGNWSGTSLNNYNFGVSGFKEKSLAEFLGDLVLCESALAADKMQNVFSGSGQFMGGTTYKLIPNQNNIIELTNSTIVGTPTVNFYDSDLSELNLDWSGSNAPTGVALTLESNPDITYNIGESNSPGAFIYSANPNVKNLVQLKAVANKMLNFNKAFSPVSITTETARTFQDITFDSQDLSFFFLFPTIITETFWLKPINLANVLDTITVTNTELGYVNLPMIVTGRTIEITPDNWTTTYNLWKGFTN